VGTIYQNEPRYSLVSCDIMTAWNCKGLKVDLLDVPRNWLLEDHCHNSTHVMVWRRLKFVITLHNNYMSLQGDPEVTWRFRPHFK
jgi:hypothetical protein